MTDLAADYLVLAERLAAPPPAVEILWPDEPALPPLPDAETERWQEFLMQSLGIPPDLGAGDRLAEYGRGAAERAFRSLWMTRRLDYFNHRLAIAYANPALGEPHDPDRAGPVAGGGPAGLDPGGDRAVPAPGPDPG